MQSREASHRFLSALPLGDSWGFVAAQQHDEGFLTRGQRKAGSEERGRRGREHVSDVTAAPVHTSAVIWIPSRSGTRDHNKRNLLLVSKLFFTNSPIQFRSHICLQIIEK